MTVLECYEQALSRRGFSPDPAQYRAVERLQRAFDEWNEYKYQRSSAFRRLLNRPDVPRGIYLSGRPPPRMSLLMDSFFKAVPLVRKTRLHFHEIMRAVHQQL